MLAALALSPALSRANAAEFYLGRWTENPAWCANTHRNSDEMPITITPRGIETFASYCRVLTVTRQRTQKGTQWRIRTSCRDEGQTAQEARTPVTFVLRLDGDRLVLRDEAGTQNLTRCKP